MNANNNAKLREVIAECVNLITKFGNAEIVKTPLDVIIDIEAMLKAALAEPPRNCDRFETKEEAALAYAEACNALFPQSILWEAGELLDWLFAEAKGEAK